MPYYVTVTCPHCDKTHRFTMLPEGEAGKENGVDCSQNTRTPEELAEKLRELKGKPDERTAAIRKQLADLMGKDEQGRQLPDEDIEKGLLQRQKKEKDSAPGLSKKRRSRLLSKRLKDHPASTRKPKTSALMNSKLSQISSLHNMAAMLAGKGLAQ